MQDDVVADDAVVINGDVWIEKAVVSYLSALFDNDMGVNLTALAHYSVLTDVGKRTYIGILANLCGFCHASEGMDALALGRVLFVEGEQSGYGFVSIVHLHEGGRDGLRRRKVAVDENDSGFRFVEIVFVFRISEEGDGSFNTFFNLCKCLNGGFGISNYFAAKIGRNLLCGKFHTFLLVRYRVSSV